MKKSFPGQPGIVDVDEMDSIENMDKFIQEMEHGEKFPCDTKMLEISDTKKTLTTND